MEFVALRYSSFPVVRFAHVHDTPHSSWDIHAHEKLTEITFIEKGGVIEKSLDTNEKRVFGEGDVFTTVHKNYVVEAVGDFHRHVTFAMEPDSVSDILQAKDVVEMSVSIQDDKIMTAILPLVFEDEDFAALTLKIKKIVDIFHSGDTFRTLKSSAILMNILSYATTRSIEMAQKEVSGIRKYNHTIYCQQAMRYIANHITEPINVEDIAESMNVSYGHLSRLFKKQTSLTLVDYINKEKVKKMEELLWTKKMSVSEVAQGVGISDEKYASRLFRRYTGLTISAYVKLHTTQ